MSAPTPIMAASASDSGTCVTLIFWIVKHRLAAVYVSIHGVSEIWRDLVSANGEKWR